MPQICGLTKKLQHLNFGNFSAANMIKIHPFYKHFIKKLPYLFEYKSHFFVPENQSKNGGATCTRGYVKRPAKITTDTYENMRLPYLFASAPIYTYLINVIKSQ